MFKHHFPEYLFRTMAKKRRAPGKAKPTRSRGKARPGKRPITPEVLLKIGKMWLKGRNNCEIAREIGVDEKTIRYHLQANIRPLWQENMRSRLAEDLAKVSLLEATAWERFDSSAPSETHEQVEKALLEGGSKPRIVKQATRTVTKTGEAAWLQIIQWCLDFRARIHAHYAPTRTRIDVGSELRVAGKTPSEVDQEMLKRLMEQIAERRKHQAALDAERN